MESLPSKKYVTKLSIEFVIPLREIGAVLKEDYQWRSLNGNSKLKLFSINSNRKKTGNKNDHHHCAFCTMSDWVTEFCLKVRGNETRGIEKSYHLCLDLSSRQWTFSEEKKKTAEQIWDREWKTRFFYCFYFIYYSKSFPLKASILFIYLFIYLFISDIHAGWSSSIQAGLSGGLPILSIFCSK